MKFSSQFIKANNEICDFDHHVPAPYFRRTFDLDFVPTDAEIVICGLGFYELTVNGVNVTKGPLAPYISNPGDICYYDRYDIAKHLKKGKNAIGVLLGNGFRNSFGGFIWDFEKSASRGPVTFALSFTAKNGKKELAFEADERFLTHPSPVVFDEERMGCRYDARLEIPGWDLPDFDDSGWVPAMKEATPTGKPRLCDVDPIAVRREIAPVEVKFYEESPFCFEHGYSGAPVIERTYRKNVYLYDFGINTTGVTRLKLKNAKPGQRIVIRHGEYVQDGYFTVLTTIFNRPRSVDKYLEYGQTDVYVARGGDEEIFLPRFKYDGFRYAFVEGLEPEQATKDALTYLEMSSALRPRAGFTSSDETLNKLYEMALRSDLSNFFYFPTDCPHREKNGWTGDAVCSAEQFLVNFAAEKSLTEWLVNIRAAQRPSGELPGIVPTGGWGFEWGNGPMWDAVIVVLPYQIYRFTGDKQVILDNAEAITRYLRYAATKRDKNGLCAYGLGDWLDPFQNQNGGKIHAPLELTDSAVLHHIAVKAAFLFREAGLDAEAAEAEKFASEMRRAIRAHLIDFSTMTVAGNCQASQALALETGLFDDAELVPARMKLVEIIHRDGDINACGMIGLRVIFHALVHAGEADLAHAIMVSESRTGFGSLIVRGATTLWESFPEFDGHGINSMNHHFYGDISNWMIGDLVGLVPNPTCRDIHSFMIAPHFVSSVNNASAWFDSPDGRISCAWERRSDGTILVSLSIPAGETGMFRPDFGYLSDAPAVLTAGEYKIVCRR